MTQYPRSLRSRFFAAVSLLLINNLLFAGQSDLGLRVLVVQGEGAQNLLEQIPAAPITVRIVDRNNRPINGATVVFTAPETGPGGEFANGLNTLTTMSDADGLAVAAQFHPNATEGRYQINVRAEFLGEVQVATIRQNNVAPKKSLGKMIMIAALAGAVAGAAALAAGRGSGNAASNPATPPSPSIPTITFGGSSVGGPR